MSSVDRSNSRTALYAKRWPSALSTDWTASVRACNRCRALRQALTRWTDGEHLCTACSFHRAQTIKEVSGDK